MHIFSTSLVKKYICLILTNSVDLYFFSSDFISFQYCTTTCDFTSVSDPNWFYSQIIEQIRRAEIMIIYDLPFCCKVKTRTKINLKYYRKNVKFNLILTEWTSHPVQMSSPQAPPRQIWNDQFQTKFGSTGSKPNLQKILVRGSTPWCYLGQSRVSWCDQKSVHWCNEDIATALKKR